MEESTGMEIQLEVDALLDNGNHKSEIQKEANTSSANEAQTEGLVNDITRMLESSKPPISIEDSISVPNHLRNLNEQAFTPLLISIGPIHRSNVKLQIMKKYKVRYLDCFINKRTKINLKNLVSAIKEMEENIRCCYPETASSSMSSNDFVKMIVEDAIFILEHFWRFLDSKRGTEGWAQEDSSIALWMYSFVRTDLVLLENQLPFFVLEKLFNLSFSNDSNPHSFIELAFEFFSVVYNIQEMTIEDFKKCLDGGKGKKMEGGRNIHPEVKAEHLTDLIRAFHLSSPLPERVFEVEKLLYTATQLHDAGVKFKVSSNKSLLGMEFDFENGVLAIPQLKLYKETVHLIPNLIALEQTRYSEKAYVTDYFVILGFLVDITKDMDLLCENEILVNYLGDSNTATSAVNKLNTKILWGDMNPNYSRICKELNAFYKKSWHRWKATLWHQYFSTPWRAASTIAAVILLVLTLIQAVCSVIQVVSTV